MIVAAIAIPLFVLWVAGHIHSHSLQRGLSIRYQRNANGIIVGAEDIARTGTNGAAVLLIHGGGDTPQTMWRLADELHNRGYTVMAPLLPGHGRNLAEFSAHSADDWYAEVRRRYLALRVNHPWVGVVGLSMGAALSARLAAETPDMPALVLASPYLGMPRSGDLVTSSSWLWAFFVPYVSTASDLSIFDPEARSHSLGYGAMSSASLRALRITAIRGRESLDAIRAPTLVVQSMTDNRVTSAGTKQAFARLRVSDKAIVWIEGAGHVITVDHGWERVVSQIADWLDSHRK